MFVDGKFIFYETDWLPIGTTLHRIIADIVKVIIYIFIFQFYVMFDKTDYLI